MVAALTYATYVTELANLAVVEETNAAYVTNLPSCINWAELAIYRDLDLLSTVTPIPGYTLTANGRTLTFPIGDFITLQQVNVITPVGTTNPDLGTRNACLPVTKERLDFEWPSSTGAGIPKQFAMINQNTIAFGPWPNQTYSAELVGTVRPASLSASNTTTFISTYLPDLMLAASMVFISGYQHNFGRQSDDPQMALSWQQQYDLHKGAALAEEVRKKFGSTGWTSMSPSPTASPARG